MTLRKLTEAASSEGRTTRLPRVAHDSQHGVSMVRAMPAAGMARGLARRPQTVRSARLPVACFWDQAVPGTASASFSASAR